MSSDSRTLTSWKEIAHYLSVNVRTAQKWERDRGLPIQRNTGIRGRVSIDTKDLDTWREQQFVRQAKRDNCEFRWPLGPGLMVELHFVGQNLRPVHIDLLREYLELFKTALV